MNNPWPSLEYSDWKATYETLHRWVQIVGKLRLCKSPWINHSWGSTFYVTSRGLTTSAIPLGDRNITVEFDFLLHQLHFLDSFGKNISISLQNESVATFYGRFQKCLEELEVTATYSPIPNELVTAIPFAMDNIHRTYVKEHAHRYWQVMVRVSNVLQNFRAQFSGKSSPVHFFWGSFDLAVTRFSGRDAPEHPGGIPHLSDEVVKEAYSHEVMSCGFWPGNEAYPFTAFYAYAYPEPTHFSQTKVIPKEAFYHPDLHEFVFPYEAARTATDPSGAIMNFFNSSYTAASNLGEWDKDHLEGGSHLLNLQKNNQQTINFSQ